MDLYSELYYDYSHYTKEFQDQRYLNTFSIDPKETQDVDDAISIDLENKRIYIHIVDINKNIMVNSKNDCKALEKCFTLYTPENKIINILPDYLAEDLFSLKAGKLRHVITIELIFDDDDNYLNYDIYQSLILNKRQYTYEEANFFKSKKEFQYLDKVLNNLNINLNKTFPNLKLYVKNNDLVFFETKKNDSFSEILIQKSMILTNNIISSEIY